MLRKISVNNFALIKALRLELEDGFSVITGETGSGKSILLGALHLILGERADYSVIRDTEKKTIVEAEFVLLSPTYLSFFEANDLDFEENTIIRREIAAKGKSRAFINDTPVQLSVLKNLTQQLVHIHSQHHTLAIKDKNFQLSILDTMAGNEALLKKYRSDFTIYLEGNKVLDQLKERLNNLQLELEFNQFQLKELMDLQLENEDYKALQKAVERGEKFEEIQAAYSQIIKQLDSENGIEVQLQHLISETKVNDKKIVSLVDRLRSVLIELKDIREEAEDEASEMHIASEDLTINIQKLDEFNSALQKHRVQNQAELRSVFHRLQNEVENVDGLDIAIAQKEKAQKNKYQELIQIASKLTERRQKSAKNVEHKVIQLLQELKLEGATIQFTFSEKTLGKDGKDEISLLFAPNKGIVSKSIEKSASGGELSRLMLVFQYLLSQKKQLPTIIFDEIDTGVSGEVAQKIGQLLKGMGENMQLMAITHLPQVAGKGEHHFLVKKKLEKGVSQSEIYPLNQEERITEIAKLMSGSTINEAAILNAKNLMNE